jgi:hypothetical protein
MKRYSLILPLMFFICAGASPPSAAADANGSLAGTVSTSEGRTLIGAVVALFKLDDRSAVISLTRSDQRGIYRLTDIAPGAYTLQVSRAGYQVLRAPRITIPAGATVTLNFVLQEFLDFISARNDPRNWDLRTVMRSTSDRRLIFRGLPGQSNEAARDEGFHRGGTLNIASSALLGGDYAVYPNLGGAGIASNFAFAEPLGQHGRMIFSGQLTSGYDSLWRVRDTFQYRSGAGQEWRFSLGYGRLNLNRLDVGTLTRPAEFFRQDPIQRDSGVETLAMSFQASSEFLNTLSLDYGFDVSRINYGATKHVWSPYFQVAVTPSQGWLLRTMMTSRRTSDNYAVALPDGDVINLLEPAAITKINDQINISQVNHAELSIARKLAEDTSLEVTVYRDRVDGPGTPFLMTSHTKSGKKVRAAQLRSDQDAQQGIRVAFARMLMDSVRGSVTYNYGSAASLIGPGGLISGDFFASRVLDFIQRSYYHSVTSQLEAKIPQTRTQLQATLRWNPGNPISAIDQFADRTDTFTKGMSFSLRQAIPLPEFMACAGRWEALVDIRNPFDMGKNRIPTSDGEITLTRNPRTLRFGLNLNFF